MAPSRNPHRSSNRLVNIWGSRPGAQRMKRERFDVDNGQVFTETIVRAPRSTAEMNTRTRLEGVFAKAREKRDAGAPSLEDIAIRSFLKNVDFVTPETLVGLPSELGKKLWKQLEDLELARPSIWAAFAAAFPNEEQFQYYRGSEIHPTKTFAEYVDFLGCPNFEWLTSLTLSRIPLDRADIMRVSSLSNIVAMDIFSSTSELDQDHGIGISIVDDQVVRDWGRRATECGSFSKLRVIILRNQRNLTVKSLGYLCAFPRLSLFGVSGCAVSAQHGETAQKHGWTLDDDRGILVRIKSDMDKSHTWDGALGACVKYSTILHDDFETEAKSGDPPILSYRLGHTSSDVIYSVPLVFFRCFERRPTTELYSQDGGVVADPPAMPTGTRHRRTSSNCHLDKKRKIKVSAQRSFESTLSEFGIDVARPAIPPKSNSDSSIDQASTPRRRRQSFKKSSSNPATPEHALVKRRQARQDRGRPWRQSPDEKT